MVTADGNRLEDARWGRVIRAAGPPAPYVATVHNAHDRSLPLSMVLRFRSGALSAPPPHVLLASAASSSVQHRLVPSGCGA